MSDSPLGFVCVKGVALAVTDLEALCLPPASIEGEEGVYQLGKTMLILKLIAMASRLTEPNPRITVENANAFEKAPQAA